MDMKKVWISRVELCEELQLHANTLRSWEKKGELTPHKLHSKVYYLRQEVNDLMRKESGITGE